MSEFKHFTLDDLRQADALSHPAHDFPRFFLIFLTMLDNGGPIAADEIARVYELEMDNLKAYCRQAAELLNSERGFLHANEKVLADWAGY
ncbi:hypothetical protein [Pseudomonas sp. Teo4]|uniref:hypothetical protein n=1 Tax=Pseudomonas sp. Teo4 TaxID=3064528 RepID=UPI002AB95CDF|nr:hypothetical protein [Pseudomonas sp. Teo4]MDZ3993087.1 hypothetical protein [Pseudomonas sp. Teo4]